MPDPSPLPDTRPRWRRAALGVLTLVLVAVLGAFGWRAATRGMLPSDAQKSRYIGALEATVLPVVTELRVEYFMDESDCANLTYARGDFVDGDPMTCGGSTERAVPFDDTARADHARVAAALKQSGTPIGRTGGTVREGTLRSAWFVSNYGAPLATTWELVHDPQDVEPKTGSDQVSVTPVPGNDGWWFSCCSD